MSLLDAAASTAFAVRPPPPPAAAAIGASAGTGGVHPQQQGGMAGGALPVRTDGDRSATTPVPPSGRGGDPLALPQGPLFTFGAIADVQYADQKDGWNYKRDYRRYYRGGLVKLREAVDVWLRDEKHRFVLQLGDVIDGSNKRNGRSETALASVKAEIDRLAASLPLGVLNSLGNHELYNFPKQRWAREVDCSNRARAVALRPSGPAAIAAAAQGETEKTSAPSARSGQRPESESGAAAGASGGPPPELELAARAAAATAAGGGEDEGGGDGQERPAECFYYSFCPDDSHRFIALDSYDVNAIQDQAAGAGGGEGGIEAGKDGAEGGEGGGGGGSVSAGVGGRGGTEALDKLNPNADKNEDEGMEGLDKRFVKYNGGVGAEQLRWLENELSEAARSGQRVVGFGHVPIHPAEPSAHTLLWNYEEVLAVMHKFDCVAMYLSGHRHRETYVRDENGIHHVSLAAALEAPVDQEAFASVDVFPDRLELRGHGVVESRTLGVRALA